MLKTLKGDGRMENQAVDTPQAPVDPGQPAEPTTQADATQDGGQPAQPAQEAQPVAPQLTPEERERQLEERMVQRMSSWTGRRDKALLDSMGQLIDSRLRSVQPAPQMAPPASPASPVDAAALLEKPDFVIGKILEEQAPRLFERVMQQRTVADQQYTNDVVKGAAAIMDSDPLFTDVSFGNEVVSEIQKEFGNMRRDIDPSIAAQLIVNKAVTNVYRKNKAPVNGLSGNRPAGVPLGGVKPPPAQTPKAPPVKLSPEAKLLAERFGYKDEDLAKVFAVEG